MNKHRDSLYTAIENKKEEIETAKEELKEMEERLKERPNISIEAIAGATSISKIDEKVIDNNLNQNNLLKEGYLQQHIRSLEKELDETVSSYEKELEDLEEERLTYMEVHKSEVAKLESRIIEKNKVIEALNEHNKKLKNEIFRLNKEINKTTLEKRYIINIKENMRKLLGED